MPPAPDPAPPPARELRPPSGWEPLDLAELWRGRELFLVLAGRDIKVRYKQTALGVAWAVLQPLLMMAVFTMFFGRLARLPSGGMPYHLFVLCGLLPWTMFSTAVTAGAQSVVGSERLVTKIYFPRLLIPLSACAVSLVDFAVGFVLLILIMAGSGAPIGWTAPLAAIPAVLCLLAAAGVASAAAALNVRYRDFKYVIPFFVQFGMFATPSIYMDVAAYRHTGPVATVIALNPLNGLVQAVRDLAVGAPLHWPGLLGGGAAALLIFAGGCLFFRQAEPRLSDVI